MPKARIQRNATKPVAVPQGLPEGALTLEQKKKRLAGYLVQFDQELKARLALIDTEYKNIARQINNAGKLILVQLPNEVKDMPLHEYLMMKNSGSQDTSANDLMGEISPLAVFNRPHLSKRMQTPGWTATPKETPMLDTRLKQLVV